MSDRGIAPDAWSLYSPPSAVWNFGNMWEMLSYGFMQRAFVAASLIGLVCAAVGVFVMLRGLSLVGEGTAHAAFAGVALAFLIGAPPLPLAIAFALATAWATGWLQERGRLQVDAAISIVYTLTMALAVLFIGLMKEANPQVYGYLFGNLLSVTPEDVRRIVALSAAILILLALFFKEFHFISFDQEMAEASGVPARPLFYLLLGLVALTIVSSMKAVGAILVVALLVIPAAAAKQWATTMRGMMTGAIAIGLFSAWTGVALSWRLDIASGVTIILLAMVFFFLSVFFSPKRRDARPTL